MTLACPDDDAIARLASGTLPRALSAQIREHLSGCESCRDLLGELARMDALSPADEVEEPTDTAEEAELLHPGAELDGYVLQRRIDAGAMGEVWLAEDPELRRRVAIKVLHGASKLGSSADPHASTAHAPDSARMLLREAQSLAQLSHPNVVVVYDVSSWCGRDYIVMEYVPGVTLSEWLSAARPGLSEILDAFVQAGRGLAAAHRASVIHRDFKPDNVLVGDDGRVRVGDFGLARLASGEARKAASGQKQTAHTGVAGTPAYMAPEQLRGAAPDAAGDQFSFAVSLYQAVYGVRPFAGATPEQLLLASERGELQAPVRRVSVPGFVRTLLMRGLSANPAQRFPSLDALVDAIEAGRTRRRRSRFGLALLATAGLAALITIPLARRAHGNPCTGEQTLLSRVWNDARAATIRSHFAALAQDYGGEQWDQARPAFEAYGKQWRELRHETCVATRIAHTQSDSLFDRRMFCLDRRLAQLDAIMGALAETDSRKLLARTRELAATLPPLDACKASSWLSDSPLPPLTARKAVDDAFASLERGRALALAGLYQDALAAFKALEPRAQKLAFAPLNADLALELGLTADRAGEFALAEQEFEHAARLAAELHRADQVFESGAPLMRMEGYLQRYDRAFGRAAELASVARLSGDPLYLVVLQDNLGSVLGWQGKHTEAVAEFRTGLSILATQTASSVQKRVQIREAGVREGLGLALMHLGDYAPAERELLHALSLRTQLFGGRHPRVAATYINLGNLAYHRGRQADALVEWQKALAIQEALSQGDTPEIALNLGNIALGERSLGRLTPALAHFERALAIKQRFLGPDHVEVMMSMSNKAGVLAQLGRFAEAHEALVEARGILERSQKPEHPEFANITLSFAELDVTRGENASGAAAQQAFRAAVPELEHGLVLARAAFGAEHKRVGLGLAVLARTQLSLGNVSGAHASAEQAVRILKKTSEPGDELLNALCVFAEVRLQQKKPDEARALLESEVKPASMSGVVQARAAFTLADALWTLGRREEAHALAERAAEVFAAAEETAAAALAARTRAWLAAHAKA